MSFLDNSDFYKYEQDYPNNELLNSIFFSNLESENLGTFSLSKKNSFESLGNLDNSKLYSLDENYPQNFYEPFEKQKELPEFNFLGNKRERDQKFTEATNEAINPFRKESFNEISSTKNLNFETSFSCSNSNGIPNTAFNTNYFSNFNSSPIEHKENEVILNQEKNFEENTQKNNEKNLEKNSSSDNDSFFPRKILNNEEIFSTNSSNLSLNENEETTQEEIPDEKNSSEKKIHLIKLIEESNKAFTKKSKIFKTNKEEIKEITKDFTSNLNPSEPQTIFEDFSQIENEKKSNANRLDYMDKEINKKFIRKPLENILNFFLKFELKTKQKLELGDFSQNVKIENLKNLHGKKIEEIFEIFGFENLKDLFNENLKEMKFSSEISQKNLKNFIKKNPFIQFKIGDKKIQKIQNEKDYEKIIELLSQKINLLKEVKKTENFKKIKNFTIDSFYKNILTAKFFNEEIFSLEKKYGKSIEKRARERLDTSLMEGYKK